MVRTVLFLVLFSAALLAAMGLLALFLRFCSNIVVDLRSMLGQRRRRSFPGRPGGSGRIFPTGSGFEGLAARARDLILLSTDLTGTITAWSPGAERILGFDGSAVRGVMPVEFLFAADELATLGEIHFRTFGQRARAFDCLVAAHQNGKAEEMEWSWIGSSGLPMPVRLAITPLSGSGGAPDGYLFLARPISRAGQPREQAPTAAIRQEKVADPALEPEDIVQPILP